MDLPWIETTECIGYAAFRVKHGILLWAQGTPGHVILHCANGSLDWNMDDEYNQTHIRTSWWGESSVWNSELDEAIQVAKDCPFRGTTTFPSEYNGLVYCEVCVILKLRLIHDFACKLLQSGKLTTILQKRRRDDFQIHVDIPLCRLDGAHCDGSSSTVNNAAGSIETLVQFILPPARCGSRPTRWTWPNVRTQPLLRIQYGGCVGCGTSTNVLEIGSPGNGLVEQCWKERCEVPRD